jgi:hypothetical protein
MSRSGRFAIKVPFTQSRKHPHIFWAIPSFEVTLSDVHPDDYYLAFDTRSGTLVITERDDVEPSQVEPSGLDVDG